MSCVSGCRKMPRLWRRPMLSVSMMRGADQDGQRGTEDLQQGHFCFSPVGPRPKPRPAVASDLITPICVINVWRRAAVKADGERFSSWICRQHEKPTMKERILETADRLFYQRGIRAVGVDTIAAEIGISKRTLYNHFPSKDELIAAYLAAPLHQGAAVRQAAGRADPRHLRPARARFCQQGFSRLPVRQRGRRTRRRGSVGPEDRGCLQGKPPPLVSRSAEAARCRRRGRPRDPAHAAGRRRDRAGSRAQRSLDGARGEGSGEGAVEECGGEGGRRDAQLRTARLSSPRTRGPIRRGGVVKLGSRCEVFASSDDRGGYRDLLLSQRTPAERTHAAADTTRLRPSCLAR